MELHVKKKALAGIAALVAIVAGYIYMDQDQEQEQEVSADIFAEKSDVFTEPEEGTVSVESESTVIKVDVKGAIQNPGVFTAETGDRVIDIIAAAGDFTENADKDRVNLAQLVEDQMVIYVPKIGEESTFVSEKAQPQGTVSDDGKVNLNSASQTELETIPGIGPSKALTIIEYREQNGPFQSVEDIKNISGIGDKTFEKLKDSIIVK
jgi:competence protein ComEA